LIAEDKYALRSNIYLKVFFLYIFFDSITVTLHYSSPDFSSCGSLVPDKRSRILEDVVVRRIFNLGTGNLEWGGNGKGLRKGRSVYK
jgi:hypothetical protein